MKGKFITIEGMDYKSYYILSINLMLRLSIRFSLPNCAS